MSFGPTAQTSQAMSGLGANAGTASSAASPLINSGTNAFAPAQNFFSSILGGNKADTSTALAPSIQQIGEGNQNAIQTASTLSPRGGGRSSSLFSLMTQPNAAVTNLFNSARMGAAQTLPQIGAQELGAGTGLLNSSNQANQGLGNLGQTQQQITAKLWQQLGQGIAGLATTPFGGGGSANGLLGLIGG